MTPERRPEAARRWLEEARERLDHARTYQGGSRRILCEQAHYAIEYAIKSVIIARGDSFPTVHDIGLLLNSAGPKMSVRHSCAHSCHNLATSDRSNDDINGGVRCVIRASVASRVHRRVSRAFVRASHPRSAKSGGPPGWRDQP